MLPEQTFYVWLRRHDVDAEKALNLVERLRFTLHDERIAALIEEISCMNSIPYGETAHISRELQCSLDQIQEMLKLWYAYCKSTSSSTRRIPHLVEEVTTYSIIPEPE